MLFDNLCEIHGFNKACRIDFIKGQFASFEKPASEILLIFSPIPFSNPNIINNAIVQISNQNNLNKTFQYLENIRVPHILNIDTISKSFGQLKSFIKYFSLFGFHKSTFLFDFCEDFYDDQIIDVFKTTNRLEKIVFYNSPCEINVENKIWFISRGFNSFNRSKNDFVCDITLFTESQAHHTYFNRKLYIGSNGEIKNAPECPETFGFIQDLESPEELKTIIQTPEFQKYWFVHKEITDVCKDCEFRHMCVDNRLPHQRSENEWYHQTECNYNPYIAKWPHEEGYRTLEECGVISNENEFSIDHDKIAEINKELWGEDQ
jgi:hypothetical protein